jgi:hypothetical protein
MLFIANVLASIKFRNGAQEIDVRGKSHQKFNVVLLTV